MQAQRFYGLQDILQFIIGCGRQGKPDPSRFMGKVARQNFICDLFTVLAVYIQQIVTVCTGTGAATSYLDTETVIGILTTRL